jgi:hypothetical protein
VRLLQQQAVGPQWELKVELRQSGTATPYRLRVPLQLRGEEGQCQLEIVVMKQATEQFTFRVPFRVKKIDLLTATGHTLIRPAEPSGVRVE